MDKLRKIQLGATGLMVTKTAFGALPIQRISFDESREILRAAYSAGINYFDTANAYTDSEKKIGDALADVRADIVLATKTSLLSVDAMKRNLEQSLRDMKTDYIDVFQLHNPERLIAADSPEYEFLLDAKRQGMIRHIGITNHRIDIAREAVLSGLYEVMQFPFSALASEREIEFAELCAARDVGFVAMKAMAGGLIRRPAATFAFLERYPNVVGIYGIQRMVELEQWAAFDRDPPADDDAMQQLIDEERAALSGDFCRGCGYCMPCAVDIHISWAARMDMLLTRSPYKPLISKEWRDKMDLIDNCIDCGLCKSRCPYSLDTPNLLRSQLAFYRAFVEQHAGELE